MVLGYDGEKSRHRSFLSLKSPGSNSILKTPDPAGESWKEGGPNRTCHCPSRDTDGMRHLHPLSSSLELPIGQPNQKPENPRVLLMKSIRWASESTEQEKGGECIWRNNERYPVHSHDPVMMSNYYLSIPLPSGWLHIASRILSVLCAIIFLSFNSKLNNML